MALSIVYWTNYVSGHSKLCRKSEASVESDRVLRFLFDNDNRVVTANVQASMKNTSYGVKIFLDEGDNGIIKTTECACPMREFKCHHVAAALLFGYKRASKTDVKCSWIKNPKSAPPKSTVTMATLYPPKQQEYRALKRTMNTEDRHFLYEQLGTLGRFTALHWILAEEPQVQQLSVPLIPDLLMDPQYLAAPDPDMWLIDNLPLTQEQVVETAFITVGQRENTHWAAVRKLRFTASNFGQILSAAKRNRLTASLKKRLLSAYNLEKRAPIQWGITNEKVAIEQYCQTGRVTVVQTGIWLHTSGVLGASPDGFVQGSYAGPVHQQEPGDYNAADILEVKCPFTAKDSSIMEVCRKNKDFYLEITDEGRFRLKPSHDYWHQIQGQLHLTGTTTCDFVVWCPHDMVVVRIKRDDTWAENLDVLIRFYFSNFLPSMK